MRSKIKYFYFLIFIITPAYAFAYLDPGTGSLLVYAIIGIISSIIFAFRNLWYTLIELFFSKHGENAVNVLPDIVFYSEGGKYWQVFKPVIKELIKKDIPCAYITADKNDKGLTFAEKYNIDKSLYYPINPGKEIMTISFLNRIKTKLLISTTPALDVYMWKRSKNVRLYAHLFHAPTGVDLYEKYALSFYDAVFTVGDFQESAQNTLDNYRGLPYKKFYPTGCTYYDYLLKEINENKLEKNTLLYAPSWGARSSLIKYKTDIIERLLETKMKVIFRPHPQSFTSDKEVIKEIQRRYGFNNNFEFDSNGTGTESMNKAFILITDLSGIIFDFAYLYNRPIVLVNYETDLGGYEAEDLGDRGFDVKASLQLVEKTCSHINELPNLINEVKNNYSNAAEKIKIFREKNLYNFGKAGKAAAENIISILKELE